MIQGRILSSVGMRNYLIEGVSGTGKTSVCKELRRRGYQAINGDTDLAYQGDPETGEARNDVPSRWHHIWSADRVRALVADQGERFTFFCGGSRNFSKFLDLFDGVFVLEIDSETLNRRLDQRLGFYGREGVAAEVGASPEGRASAGWSSPTSSAARRGSTRSSRRPRRPAPRSSSSPATKQWGGYGGSFADPDGYIWDIGYSAQGKS
jgi:hypothetical protein